MAIIDPDETSREIEARLRAVSLMLDIATDELKKTIELARQRLDRSEGKSDE